MCIVVSGRQAAQTNKLINSRAVFLAGVGDAFSAVGQRTRESRIPGGVVVKPCPGMLSRSGTPFVHSLALLNWKETCPTKMKGSAALPTSR